jgi:hypothetical protein
MKQTASAPKAANPDTLLISPLAAGGCCHSHRQLLPTRSCVALHVMYYNFVRIHQTLKVTPAMAAGVTDRLWEMKDLVEMLEAFEAKRAA